MSTHEDHRKPALGYAAAVLTAICLSIPAVASAAQVCTVQRVGNDEFRGISGTADNAIIAVAKKGSIYGFDGTSWTAMSNASGEDLNAVYSLGASAFAVGEDGEVVTLSGGSWSSMAVGTNDDLFAVWAASGGEVYVGGEKGAFYAWNGASWSDLSAAAGTGNKDIVDIRGDGGTVYAVDEDGNLYRYDRGSGSWLAPDSACDNGDRYTSLWTGPSGSVYLTADQAVYRYDGASCLLVTSASRKLLGVSGWDSTGDVTAVGQKGVLLESSSGGWIESAVGNKDLADVWVSPTGNAYFAGKNKELTVCECTDCAVTGQAEFLIGHDGYGINCQAEVVQVQVFDALSGSLKTDYASEVTLDTGSGSGGWTLLSGSGSLVDAAADDGVATYTWAAGETAASFALDYPQGTPSIDIDVYESADPTVRDTDAEGAMIFGASGFSVTAAPLANPVSGPVIPFAMPQIAGAGFPVYITAYGQTPSDPECGVIESYSGIRPLEFWMDYQDPGSGTRVAAIDGGAIAASEGLAGVTPVEFTNGQASVDARYKDVGRIRISVKDSSPADPDLAGGIRGATAGFVVKPYDFLLSNIADAGGAPNPGAGDAAGPVFVAAGEPFSVTVTARDAEGTPTPNYGRESVAESVVLTPALAAPATGDLPPVAAPAGFAAFANGTATGGDFSWPEVGIINLRPEVADGDYLGAGNVLGVVSGNVGRFIPHHFDVSLNVPQFATACAAGNFTYIGQPFVYAVQPEITFTAIALGGETTENYEGAFFRMTDDALPDPVYAVISGTLDAGSLAAVDPDPVIGPLGAGQGTLTYSVGTGLSFTKAAPVPEFDAEISLAQTLTDADGVAASGNPVMFGAVGGMLFDSGAAMRHGRLRIANAYGSELVDLAVPLVSEYFVDATTGYVQNTEDSCTTPVTLGLGAYTENLGAGETCVLDSGAPGASGAGCGTAAIPGRQFRVPPLAGDFNLYLAAPGDGNDGSVRIDVDAPEWLESDWDGGTPGLEDPQGTAVFGIFGGGSKVIYRRELY